MLRRRMDSLLEIIRFTESLSTRLYGLPGMDQVFAELNKSFSSSAYSATVLLLCDDNKHLRIKTSSLAGIKPDFGQEFQDPKFQEYPLSLDKQVIHKAVIRQGKTFQLPIQDLLRETLPSPLLNPIQDLFGLHERNTIITPLYFQEKIIGSFAMSSPELSEDFIPSVKILVRHLTRALELANENALRREAEQRSVEILESMGEAVTIFDLKGKILQINEFMAANLGVRKEEIIGKTALEAGLVTPELNDRIEAELMPRLIRDGRLFDFEVPSLLKNGRKVVVSMNWSLLRNEHGAPAAIINVAKNITPLKEAQAVLQDFSRKMLFAREEEKKKIAANLHDEVGGMVVSLTTTLCLAEEETRNQNIESAQNRIRQARQLTGDFVRNIKRISADLRPPQLDIIGLVSALREYFDGLMNNHAITIHLDENIEGLHLSETSSIAIYRVVQEAMTNVIKHSGARNVRVGLTIAGEVLTVSVKDNGHGFDPKTLPESSVGIGLLGMKERIASLGGRFDLDSAPGLGAELQAVFPIGVLVEAI